MSKISDLIKRANRLREEECEKFLTDSRAAIVKARDKKEKQENIK